MPINRNKMLAGQHENVTKIYHEKHMMLLKCPEHYNAWLRSGGWISSLSGVVDYHGTSPIKYPCFVYASPAINVPVFLYEEDLDMMSSVIIRADKEII